MYFDQTKMYDNPGATYLSDLGQFKVVQWSTILEDRGYFLETPQDLYGAAGFLVARGFSDVDIITTAIMLTFLQSAWEKIGL